MNSSETRVPAFTMSTSGGLKPTRRLRELMLIYSVNIYLLHSVKHGVYRDEQVEESLPSWSLYLLEITSPPRKW